MKEKTASSSLSQVEVAYLRAARAGILEKVLNFLNEDGDIHTCNANGLNALHLSSKEGHIEVVKELLKRGAGVNFTTKKGNTALHIAALAGQKLAVEVLLDSGASVNSKAQNGFTPLYMAAQEGHVDVVRILLSKGANQQCTTEDGFTPIDVAVQQGHEKVVAALLHHDSRKGYRSLHTAARKDFAKAAKLLLVKDHKPDVEAPNGFTPLHIAAKYGNLNVAGVLIQHGATIDFKTKIYVIAPLHVAAKYGNINIVTLLVEKGSKVDIPNKDGLTPLHCAARDGHDAVVEFLTSKKASITARTKHGLTPLHMSCQGNHPSTSGLLIDNKAPVNAVATNGLTPLHIAAHYGHVDITELLLNRGADTDARARNGFTPLHVACKKNREQVIQLLLKFGANVHSANEGGQTPMHVATYYGNVTLVLILLQHGGSPDITNVRGETALHIACRRRQITIVRLLLRNGAAVDAKTQDRETPLHIAVRTKNVEMVNLLLDHGASTDVIDKNKCTPLHIAARDGNEELVEILVEHGASVTELSKKGFTPLHEAARHGHIKIIEILLKYYDNPDPEGKHGLTPLHVATHYNKEKVAIFLLDNEANPHIQAKNGFTPLHIGAKKNRIDIVLLLLRRGMDPDITTQTGISPLHLSAKEGHVELCEHLVENGAMPGLTTNNGLTPLHLTARENRIEVAKLLLKYNAPINAQTVSGFTPLHIACVYGHFELAKLLLEAGADIEAKTKHGYMALHLAAQYGHALIITLLLENGAPPDALTNDGYTALYISQRVNLNTTIIETLTKVTEYHITLRRKPKRGAAEGEEEDRLSDEIIFSAEPEELEEEEVLEALELPEVEEEPPSPEESYDRFMTMEDMVEDDQRSSSLSRHRDSGIFSSSRYSGAFLEGGTPSGSRASDLDRSRFSEFSESQNITVSEINVVESELPSSLADMAADNVPKYEPLTTGDFLVSFLVDARGGKMESSQTGLKITLPPRSCQAPTRITCKQIRPNKPALLPPLYEGEALACRMLNVSPSGAKFLQPVYLELPHFSALRDGERELVVLRTEDGGWNWKEVCVEDMKAVDGYSSEMNIHQGFPSKRYAKIETSDFPEKFSIISRLKKESFMVGPGGDVLKSSVLPQVQVKVPEGAVSSGTKVTLQVQPADETFNDYEDWVAVSPVVSLESGGALFSKPVSITIPTPVYSPGGDDVDIQPTLRLLSCQPEDNRKSMSHAPLYHWTDITDTTPLSIVNTCATFTTSHPARYWLMETRNPDNVTSDARLLYRKLTAVPYSVKVVVFAQVSPDGTEAHLRIFCVTDDKIDKTLEKQTGFVEVARSREVEVCEGRPVHIRCLGNVMPVSREPLQITFYPFRENRLSAIVRVTDPSLPPTCRLAFLKEPRKDRLGNVRPICNLSIDLSEENLKNGGASARLPVNLLELLSKGVGPDWIAFGQVLGFADSELQEIKDQHDSAELDKCALDVLTRWRDKEDSDASMASLEKALTEIGRENILEDFKRLAYRSYAKDPAVVVVQTRPVNSALEEVPVDDSDPGHRRISEFLDTAGEMDDMFRAEDDSSSPRTPRFSERDEVFTDENGAEPITEESVIVVEKHRLVDEEGNLIGETHKIMQDGNEVAEEDTEKLLQDFFSNDKGVLDFLASENAAKVVENGKGTEETEI